MNIRQWHLYSTEMACLGMASGALAAAPGYEANGRRAQAPLRGCEKWNFLAAFGRNLMLLCNN